MAKKKTSFSDIVVNLQELTSRLGFLRRVNGAQSTVEVRHKSLGYLDAPSFGDYKRLYRRGDIANRIVKAYPEAIWSSPPEIKDNENEELSAFDKAFMDLSERLDLFDVFQNIDITLGMSRYVVLFFGTAGVRNEGAYRTPLSRIRSVDDILYLRVLDEEQAKVDTLDNNPTSVRFGKPETYKVRISSDETAVAKSFREVAIHHSRTLHITEGLLSGLIYGAPRLESVINRLYDLDKVAGSSAETFWLNSRGGMHINAESGAVIENEKELKDNLEQFTENLDRWIKTKGMNINTLSFPIASPKDNGELSLKLISGATGIPVRILTGSERGELASSQDENAWSLRVDERRRAFCEKKIVKAFADRLIGLGAMAPQGGKYSVNWPELVSLNERDKAQVAQIKADAIAKYLAAGGDYLVDAQQFVESLGYAYNEGEINKVLDEERKEINEQEQENNAE